MYFVNKTKLLIIIVNFSNKLLMVITVMDFLIKVNKIIQFNNTLKANKIIYELFKVYTATYLDTPINLSKSH